MGKFGSKKDDGEQQDSNRLALFGSRSKNSKSPAPPPENPYAQPVIPPDPYTRAKMNMHATSGLYPQGPPPGGPAGEAPPGTQPPSNRGGNPYGAPQTSSYGGNPYGTQQGGNPYGTQNGYGGGQGGGNPYANVVQPSGVARVGGYGGLGPAKDDPTTNAARDELFGGARERVQQQESKPPPGYGGGGGGGQPDDRSYGAYGDRQLTAEEEEEEDVQAMKQEMRQMKQQDVNSTRNAMRMVEQSLETGQQTLAMLGEQGERLHKTENTIDIGQNHLNISEDQAKELKKLNKSIFAVHVNNPFTAKDRKAKRDADLLNRHQLERDQREATRDETFKSTQRLNQSFKTMEDEQKGGFSSGAKKTNYAERAKYQFDADSDDDRMEDEIDHNLDQLGRGMKQLNVLARATGKEVEAQNVLINRLAEKSDKMDDRLHMQTERLKRIH